MQRSCMSFSQGGAAGGPLETTSPSIPERKPCGHNLAFPGRSSLACGSGARSEGKAGRVVVQLREPHLPRTMPEGPELFLASQYINAACKGLIFSGKVEKSEVSKNPEVPFASRGYGISAASRGKELKLTLTPLQGETPPPPAATGQACAPRKQKGAQGPVEVVFRFGMSGRFKLVLADEMPKHAHLRFYTRGVPRQALCFVDTRRFGSWQAGGTWQPDRGPCVMLEYEEFRQNVLRNLSDKAFDKPICEALLNQKFFNGVGNYLRAEILHRLRIPPFEKARTVLEELQRWEQTPGLTLSKKVKLKRETPDLLELCHRVPLEVVGLGCKGYDPDNAADSTAFGRWLQCYSVPGMKSLRDAKGRTIWFQGDPGALAPKGERSRKKRVPVKRGPGRASAKVTAQAAEKRDEACDPPKGTEATPEPGRMKVSQTVRELRNRAAARGARAPSPRARRRHTASQAPRPTGSPLPDVPKIRASARKRRAAAPARST